MNGFILTNDALVQTFFHLKKFSRFGLHHLADRNARPLMNDFRNIVDIHNFVELMLGLPFITLGMIFLIFAQALHFDLSCALIITRVRSRIFLCL